MTTYNVCARIVTLIDAPDEATAYRMFCADLDRINAELLDEYDAFESEEQR